MILMLRYTAIFSDLLVSKGHCRGDGKAWHGASCSTADQAWLSVHEDGSTTLGNAGGTGCRGTVSVEPEPLAGTHAVDDGPVFRFDTGNCLMVSVPPLLLGGVGEIDGTPTLGLTGPGFDGAFWLVKDGT
jgi:hypothetical protein